MYAMLRAGVASAGLVAALTATAAADDPPAKKRNFIGSMEVPAEKRADLIEFLNGKGHAGAFVPDGAAPHTLLYRGTKGEYEAALDAANRHLHPEWYAPKAPVPKQKPLTPDERDAAENKKLGVSPLQEKLLAELRKEGTRRWEAIRKSAAEKGGNLTEKGAEHNVWYREQHRTILTRDQYRLWAPALAELDLGPEPKVPKVEPGVPKSDAVIFGQLGLSETQKQYLDKLENEVRVARAQLAFASDARDVPRKKAEIDLKWREGLKHALTEKQLKAFQAYWDGK